MYKLQQENDFLKYLELLKEIKDRYVIIIASRDVVGKSITQEVADKIMELGFEKSLMGQSPQTYIGIVDSGKLVYETLSKNREESFYKCRYKEADFDIVSRTNSNNNVCSIIINGADYSINKRGLNIVVYDSVTENVIDNVSFDTHVPAFRCTHVSAISTLINSINEVTAAPYTLLEYCLEKGYESVIFYTEECYWSVVQPLVLPFRIHFNKYPIMKCAVASKAFTKPYLAISGSAAQGEFDAQGLLTVEYSESDVVIALVPSYNDCVGFLQNGISKVLLLPDVLSEMMQFAYNWRAIVNFSKLHPRVTVLPLFMPTKPTKDLTAHEKEVYTSNYSTTYLRNQVNEKKLSKGALAVWNSLGLDPYESDFSAVLNPPPSSLDNDHIRRYHDFFSKYVNVTNGHRITIGQPQNSKRRIFLAGPCTLFGYACSDEQTISSYLQQELNSGVGQQHFIVENYGMYFHLRHEDLYNNLATLPVQDGDIVIIVINRICTDLCKISIDLSSLFQRPHNFGEVWACTRHQNANGNRAIASEILKFLQEHDFFDGNGDVNGFSTIPIAPRLPQFGIPQNLQNNDNDVDGLNGLEDYKKSLSQTRDSVFGRIGSIVMNCNPFTLGHRYLIEYAASQVAHLFIFAVEEDKSIFPFQDRFELIKSGTADLRNVTVLPSGKFIISSLTFSDYFNKSELQDKEIDPTMDVSLFGKEIAPTLNISVRFAGEEPIDLVTKQYNDTMRRILPTFGVDFVEIPRKEFNGEVISASRVRALLDEKNFEEISKIVPPTTLSYLQEKYS